MQAITSDKDAQVAFETADNLFSDVAGGMVGSTREARVLAEACALMDAVHDYYKAKGNAYGVAKVLDSLGFKARHIDDDLAAAKTRFEEAAQMFSTLSREDDRLAALIELGEIEPSHPEAVRAAYDAIERGLPEPLDDSVDPRRLAAAMADTGAADAALALYQAMIDDALRKDRNARAAILLRDVARIHEDSRKDRPAATQTLMSCLACAEASGDKTEIGAALLRLADIWSERGDRGKSRAFFDRVAAMRGLPKWQRDQIKVIKMAFA